MSRNVKLVNGRRGALFLAILSLGCASEGRYIAYESARPVAATEGVVTFVDFLEGGRAAVRDYLQSLPSAERADLEATIERASAACTRLEIITERSGLSYSQISGSAVLVRAGYHTVRLATAGHSFQEARSGEVRVTLRDGRKITTRLLQARFDEFGSSTGDWAVLETEDLGQEVPALPFRAPKAGELVLVLSYPNQMGVSEDGTVVYGAAYGGSPLAPILTVGRVSDTSPLTLEPIAGSLPLGGASGGAIVNRQGELIGVLSGTGWTPGRRGADYWINGATVEAFAHELSARPKTSRD